MECKVCGNKDEKLFFLNNGKYICRVCFEYRYPILKKENKVVKGKVNLNYELTKPQKEISSKLLELVKNGKNVLINAVCGAGKTEIIYDSLLWGLENGKRVGIAIPRKDVVEELYQRIVKDFVGVSVVRVYGGLTTCLEADVIIFTTHQAYRYIGCFDLLFVDEIDAFPFYNNPVLNSILQKCCFGSVVYMSATISKIDNCQVLHLNKRYHGYPLPVPKEVITLNLHKSLCRLLKKLSSSLVIIIYVGSIKMGESLFSYLKPFYENNICLIHSKIKNRDKVLKQIKNYDFKVIVSTTVLERGITLKDVQIVVYEANNVVFDVPTLIQISGRAGRKEKYPNGKVYFLSKYKCAKFKKVIKIIQNVNK